MKAAGTSLNQWSEITLVIATPTSSTKASRLLEFCRAAPVLWATYSPGLAQHPNLGRRIAELLSSELKVDLEFYAQLRIFFLTSSVLFPWFRVEHCLWLRGHLMLIVVWFSSQLSSWFSLSYVATSVMFLAADVLKTVVVDRRRRT